MMGETIPEGVHAVAAQMLPHGERDDSDLAFRQAIEMAYLAGKLDQQKDDNRIRLTNLSQSQWELLRAAEVWRDDAHGVNGAGDPLAHALMAAVDRLREAKAAR